MGKRTGLFEAAEPLLLGFSIDVNLLVLREVVLLQAVLLLELVAGLALLFLLRRCGVGLVEVVYGVGSPLGRLLLLQQVLLLYVLLVQNYLGCLPDMAHVNHWLIVVLDHLGGSIECPYFSTESPCRPRL